MSSPIGISEAISQKAEALVFSVTRFSETLPSNEIYHLKMRLQNCVTGLPDSLLNGLEKKSKIDKIRSFVAANGCLEECRNYLTLVEKMKYGSVSDILKQVDEVSDLLKFNSRITSKN